MRRFSVITGLFAALCLSSAAEAKLEKKFCVTNETEKTIWLSLGKLGEVSKAKLLSPKARICSLYHGQEPVYVSVSRRNGEPVHCYQALKAYDDSVIKLKSYDPAKGCVITKSKKS